MLAGTLRRVGRVRRVRPPGRSSNAPRLMVRGRRISAYGLESINGLLCSGWPADLHAVDAASKSKRVTTPSVSGPGGLMSAQIAAWSDAWWTFSVMVSKNGHWPPVAEVVLAVTRWRLRAAAPRPP